MTLVCNERATERRAAAAGRFQNALSSFGYMMEDRFRRPEPGESQRPILIKAACATIAALHQKPIAVAGDRNEGQLALLERFAAANNVRLRRISLDAAETVEGEGPLLAFLDGEHPITLIPGRWGGVEIEDPLALGRRRLSSEERKRLGRNAYAFHPVLPAGKLTLRSIMGFGLRQAWWDIAAIAACGLAGSALAMATPLAMSQIAEVGIQERDLQFLFEVGAALLFILFAQACLHVGAQFAELRMEGRAALPLHAAMMDRMLRLPASILRKTTTVMLATQMETVEKLRRSTIQCAVAGSMALLHGLTAAALVAIYVPFAGLVALGAVGVLLIASALIGWRQFQAMYQGERMDVVVMAFVYDLVRLVPVMRAHRAEDRAFVQWAQNFLAYQARLQRSARIGNLLTAFEGSWELLTLAACFAAVAIAGAEGAIGIGTAVAFVITLGKLTAAGREMAHAILNAAKLVPTSKMARPLLDAEVERGAAAASMPALRGSVKLANVGFTYEGRPVLQGLSMTVNEGEFIGIVGPSGSGKSTLLRLLLGLEAPSAGQVLIDGQDMRSLDRRQVSRQVGAVLQGGRLFAGSIFENIRGATEISLDEAWDFAAQAGVADELRAMPMGLQTLVGDDGAGLAVGQVQRILLARALACRPRILVLDEATSALDGRTQSAILKSLGQLNLTRIVVAHRPAALAGASRVLVVENGRIVDEGRPDEIALRQSPFFSAASA